MTDYDPTQIMTRRATPDVSISEDDARTVLAEALGALDWAREYQVKAQRSGPTEGASGENWNWYCTGSATVADHDRRCVEERLRKVLKLPDVDKDRVQPPEPLTIQPGPGASLWYVTDNGDVVRLDRRTEAQYPCVGRDAAILSGLLDHVRRLMEEPPQMAIQETRAEAAETVERAVRAGRGVRG